jgi:SpoVK/Ycf46/Vps4 family AAA+-type ATPase
MTPKRLHGISDDEPETPETIAEAISKSLGELVEVRLPGDCDEPILSRAVRGTVREWMLEQNAEDELRAVGVKPRVTCLLVGPPGCGKTTLSHHFAARLGMPLVIANGEMMRGKYIGETGQNIYAFFRELRRFRGKTVGFFDEIDAIATKRADDGSSAGKEKNAMVTALLTNIERHDGLFFAATNRGDALDSAVWRRFGMQIEVEIPGFEERFAILKRYLLPFVVADDTLDDLCFLTTGAAPALIRQLCEGIKRALVLAPRLKRDPADIVSIVSGAAAQISPHADFDPPPLWADPAKASSLVGKPWPPVLGARQ